MSYAEEFFAENAEAQLHLASAAKYLLEQAQHTGAVPNSVFVIFRLIMSLEEDYKMAKFFHSARKAASA